MKQITLLLLLLSLLFSCKKHIPPPDDPYDTIEEYYYIHQDFYHARYYLNKITRGNSIVSFVDDINFLTTDQFFTDNARFYYLSSNTLHSQTFSNQLLRPANTKIESVERVRVTDTDKAEQILTVTSRAISYGNPVSSELTDKELKDYIEKFKITNYNIKKLREQIIFNNKVATGKGWGFSYKTKERHRFTLIKEDGSWKIDSFQYEIVESEISSFYHSRNDGK